MPTRLAHAPDQVREFALKLAVWDEVDVVRDRLAAGEITTAEFEGEQALAEMRAVAEFKELDDEAEMERVWERWARRREKLGLGEAKFTRSRRKLQVHVSDGRWVADCPMADCNGGIDVTPEHKRAACLECLTIFSNVAFPDELDEIEALLEQRPKPNRNWLSHETPNDLREENFRRGVGPIARPG